MMLVSMLVPHVLRHFKAMHLLQSGVDLIYIRDFLVHVNCSTTEIYARADSEMKRKAIEKVYTTFIYNCFHSFLGTAFIHMSCSFLNCV